MKLTCDVIGDLLPLFVEDLASEASQRIVKEHLDLCPKCSLEYDKLIEEGKEFETREDLGPILLKNIKRKLRNINIYNISLTVLIMTLLAFVTFDKAKRPIALSYENAVEYVTKEDNYITIQFKPFINIEERTSNDEILEYEIMAWETEMSKAFDRNKSVREETKTLTIRIKEDKPVLIRYISQGKGLDKIIYGDQNENTLSLPRLAMNYYFLFMVGLFIIGGGLSLIFRGKERIARYTHILMFMGLAYALGHIAIMGIDATSYHIRSDLLSVLFASILIFAIFILIRYKGDFIRNKGKFFI